jgi:lysophospholipase L1-like esterase
MPKRTDDMKSSPRKTAKKQTTAKSPKSARSAVPAPAPRTKSGKQPTSQRTRGKARREATKAPGRVAETPGPAKRARAAAVAADTKPSPTLVPVQVVTVTDVYSGDPGSSPGSAEFAYRILAEGDSWFTIGGIPSSNLLYEMRLPQSGIVCNIAYPGDTLKHVAELAANQDLKKLLTERFGYRWHAILLSAGGNDLMDRAPLLLRNPGSGSTDPRDYLVGAQLEGFVADVQAGCRTIVGLRDSAQSANHGVPIVVHGYDYPTPRNSPARFFAVRLLGPWLHKAFHDLQIDDALRVPISDFLVNVLAEAIKVLSSGPLALPNFHFIDTRGTLDRAAADSAASSDWLNEIHPSQAGYRKIAAKISERIVALLPS